MRQKGRKRGENDEIAQCLENIGLPPTVRGEALSLSQLSKLSDELHSLLSFRWISGSFFKWINVNMINTRNIGYIITSPISV